DQVGLRQLDQSEQPGLDFRDMVAVQLRAQHQSLLVVGVYMTTAVGARGNAQKLANLGALLATIQGMWLVVGDWNMTPQELSASGWLELSQGVVAVPSNTSYTCTAGTGRMLDYLVMSASAQHLLASIEADFDTVEEAGKSHYGLDISLDFDISRAMAWTLRRPRAFDHPARPRKQPDPDSKRSKKRAARLGHQDAEANPVKVPTPAAWGAKRKLSIKSPPVLQYVHLEFEEEDFWTDNEEDDTEAPPDDAPTLEEIEEVPEVEDSTNASLQRDWTCLAKDLLWHSLSEQVARRSEPPAFVEQSLGFQADPAAARRLGEAFAEWSHTMELYYCELYQVHPQERRQYMGRGKLQEPVKQPMDGGKPWPTTSDASSRWWSTVASHLNELAHVRAGSEGLPRAQHLRGRLSALASSIPVCQIVPLPERRRARWVRSLRTLSGITSESLAKLAEAASRAAHQAQRAVARQRLQGYRDWVCQHAINGMGVLHRLVKDPMAEVSEIRYVEVTTCDGASLMEAKRAVWDKLWTPPNFSSTNAMKVLQEARDLAREEELPPLTLDGLEAALLAVSQSKAAGIDGVRQRDVWWLPEAGRQQLLALFQQIECAVAWPWQWLTAIIVLLRKPDVRKDRAIGLLTWLGRLWSRMRSRPAEVWAEAYMTSDFKQSVAESIEAQLWAGASKFRNGGGAES
ncbi:unnamed protein product, partial [Prorocentrum cordatum]